MDNLPVLRGDVINHIQLAITRTLNCGYSIFLAQSFSTLPVPAKYADIIWNAHGNIASCRAQGFFIALGSVAAPLYTCALCFYFIFVVKYKQDEYIETNIEPFLHAVPLPFLLLSVDLILRVTTLNVMAEQMPLCCSLYFRLLLLSYFCPA